MAGGAFFDYPGESTVAPVAPSDDILLSSLDDAGWNTLLGFMEIARFAQGEVVFPAGSGDRSLYLVADGTLEIVRAGDRVLIEAGGILGELSFFDGRMHEASVQALTDVDLYGLSLEAFEVMAAREPVLARTLLFDLGRILATRLRRTVTGAAAPS